MHIIKDYYQILRIGPHASQEEIKKSFRKLAHAYHPDKNPGSDVLTAYYVEVQEAYQVLSNPISKKIYDKERSRLGETVSTKPIIISESNIIQEVLKIEDSLYSRYNIEVNKTLVHDFLCFLLSPEHIHEIQKESGFSSNALIIEKIISIAQKMPFRFFEEIQPSLLLLTFKNTTLQQRIIQQRKILKARDLFNKYLPLIIIFATLLLCVAMYLYAK